MANSEQDSVSFGPWGLGGTQLGNVREEVSEASAQQLIATAWSEGARFFDTAPMYGHGLSEIRLGQGLADLPRDSYVISTKVGRALKPLDGTRLVAAGPWINPAPFEIEFDYSFDETLRQVDASLARMRLDRFDVLLVHDCDIKTHGLSRQPEVFDAAIHGAFRALVRLRDEGVVRAIGVGVNDASVCLDAIRQADLDCVLLAGQYNIACQDALRTALPAALERQVAVVLGAVFGYGVLARRMDHERAPSELERTCITYGVSPVAASVQFASAHPAVSSLCLGARTPSQVQEFRQACVEPIPSDFWAELKDLGIIDSEAPTPHS